MELKKEKVSRDMMSEDGNNVAAAAPQHQQPLLLPMNANVPLSAMISIQPPEAFDLSKPQDWERWIRRFERFRLASNLHLSTDANQVNTLIYCMGDEADDILRGQDLSDAETPLLRTCSKRTWSTPRRVNKGPHRCGAERHQFV